MPVIINKKKLTNIADAIRINLDNKDAYTVLQMQNKIAESLEKQNTRLHDFINNNENINEINVPYGVTKIRNFAISDYSNLTSIDIPDSVTEIGSYAFSGCFNLTTINVPWSEGEVANAPWGATNATINYNYTGE